MKTVSFFISFILTVLLGESDTRKTTDSSRRLGCVIYSMEWGLIHFPHIIYAAIIAVIDFLIPSTAYDANYKKTLTRSKSDNKFPPQFQKLFAEDQTNILTNFLSVLQYASIID